MTSSLRRGAILVTTLFVGAGCANSTSPSSNAATIDIVTGNNQTGFVGLSLTTPLTVKVKTSDGKPVAGAKGTFTVSPAGAATVSPATATTDANGQAQTQLTFGAAPGNVQVTATVGGSALTASFVEVAGTTNVTLACQSSAGTLPTVGQVMLSLPGTGVCLIGGTTGANYALIPFHSSQVAAAVASIAVTGRGVTALNTPNADLASVTSRSSGFANLELTPPPNRLQAAFDARLRRSARAILSPKMPAARSWLRSRGRASFNAIPSAVTVGQVLTLNANADDPCANAVFHGGRVAAITSRAIVVVDTANPPGGFTDAQWQSIGVTFDTLVDPLDRQNFGEPSDIDKNGHIVIFYTRAVNELTPRGSSTYIGGFFYERDLFPTVNTPALDGCAGSNVGEMFYMLAPDPTGVVNGNKRDSTLIRRTTISTIAHEYQHLINAARRLYVNDANDFEEVWLNEGLSHIAEELLFYHEGGLSPRQNINAARIRSTTAALNAFNNDQIANADRYDEFLRQSTSTSPYMQNDSLNTRGATWSLLRYLSDRRNGNDADAFQALDNSKTEGLANLTNVFGSDVITQIRDWGTSVFTDDLVATTDARIQQPSWNHRSVDTEGFNEAFPLLVTPLADGAVTTVNLFGGGVAYLRFTVNAGAQASIDWTASGGAPVSPLVQWTLVRTR